MLCTLHYEIIAKYVDCVYHYTRLGFKVCAVNTKTK